MLRRRPGDNLSAASRRFVLIAAIVIALAILIFFIVRPIKPSLEPSPGFGAPAPTEPPPPPPSSSGG